MRKPLAILAAALALTGCSLLPAGRDERPAPPPRTSAPVTVATPSFENRQCLAKLGANGSRFAPLPDRYFGAGCSQLGTVEISGLRGDASGFEVTNLGPVRCPTADALAAWARYGVDRAARQILGSPLARIETMGSYSCRNVAGTGRLSAHATAQAIDVGGFVLEDGRRIAVLGAWNGGTEAERRFLRVVHASACKRFGTVLGPDYNPAHRDHLHVEKGGRAGFCR